MDRSKNKFMRIGKELHEYRDLLRLLVSRDIKLKYRRSFLGYLWSILNPLMIMTVMTIVFSSVFRWDGNTGASYPVYLFCGQLIFNFMVTSTTQAIFSITGNAPLLKKTYVPRYIFTVAKITSGMVDLLFSIGALLIVMLVTKVPFSWNILMAPFVVLQVYVFSVGLGLFLAQANVFFRDIQHIYSAITVAWMYLTPIFYPLEAMDKGTQGQIVVWCIKHLNPMWSYITQFRYIFNEAQMIDWRHALFGSVVAIVMLLIGIWSFLKTEDKFILYI